MALYHKYRPQKFEDMMGQDHVKKILTEAIAQGKTVHGYLFAGPRGLGKTTTARLLAKALNCQKGNLCNACTSCLEITEGRSLDVIEIDAASNRGIDEIRELREKIKFAPNSSKYKVFIIDEVHMLTKEAFNALLKTLEEPPKHAVFVLATTEPHKVPATIISRVQRFDFRRPTIADLAEWIKTVAKKEEVLLDGQAALEIARLAEGSFRDSLTLFEQVIGEGEINIETVTKTLGLPSHEQIDKLINAMDSDSAAAIELVNNLYQDGLDFGYLYKELILKMREKMIETADSRYARWLQSLIFAQEKSKFSPLPQIPLEIAILEHGQISNTKSQILNEAPKIKSVLKPQTTEAISEDQWQKIIETIKDHNHSLAGILRQGKLVGADKDKLTIAVKFAFHKDRIEEPKNHGNLTQAISNIAGKKVAVVCVVDDSLAAPIAVDKDAILDEVLEVFGE